MDAHACNSSTWEVEAGGSLQAQGHPELHCEVCLKTKQKSEQKDWLPFRNKQRIKSEADLDTEKKNKELMLLGGKVIC